VGYYFGSDVLGIVNLNQATGPLEISIPIEWLYQNDNEEFVHAPYWPQSCDLRDPCCDICCTPPVPMPSAISLRPSNVFQGPPRLPPPLATPSSTITLREISRTPDRILWQGQDDEQQLWLITLSRERDDVSISKLRAEWGEEAFAARIQIEVSRSEDRAIAFQWDGELSGSVPVGELPEIQCQFHRNDEEGSIRNFAVTIELPNQEPPSPCGNEFQETTPYLFRQRKGALLTNQSAPWFNIDAVSQLNWRRLNSDRQIVTTEFSFVLSHFGRQKWFVRTFCLTPDQFDKVSHIYSVDVRVSNMLPRVFVPPITDPDESWITSFGLGTGPTFPPQLFGNLFVSELSTLLGGVPFFRFTNERNPFTWFLWPADLIENGALTMTLEAEVTGSGEPDRRLIFGDFYLKVAGQRSLIQTGRFLGENRFSIGVGLALDYLRTTEWEGNVIEMRTVSPVPGIPILDSGLQPIIEISNESFTPNT
jgi:hypothetical protein